VGSKNSGVSVARGIGDAVGCAGVDLTSVCEGIESVSVGCQEDIFGLCCSIGSWLIQPMMPKHARMPTIDRTTRARQWQCNFLLCQGW
jgi:hypothetical protein